MLDIPQTISGGQESKGGEIHFPCRDSAMEKKEEEISTFAFSRNVKNPIKITTTITRETETEKTPVESTSSLRKKDVNTDFPQTSQNSTSGVSMKASGGGMDKNSNPSRERIVHLRTLASTITPLHRYFSFVTQDKRIGGKDLYSPNCVRCPNCKGCQLHMQFCSGAYGMRHMLAWIVRRKSPKVGEKRTIEMRYISENTSNLNYSWRSVCRFEIGPVVITRHLIHSSKEQIIETVERGGTNGTFAGMISPRPLNFLDVFFGIFYGTTDRGRDKRYYRVLQRTAMRSVAAQARALWEKLTFSPEKQNLAVLAQIPRNKKENGDFIPQRVQVDWRCPPLFFSLLPSAQEGNSGLTFVLWISVLARSCLTAHVMDNGELWRSPHTCTVETEKEKKETTTTTTTTTVKSTTTPLWDENFISTSNGKWEGEVRCRRCHIPGSHWGLITRRHREEKDKVVTILRVRRSCIQREVTRRAILSHYHNNSIHKKPNMNNGEKEIKNDVIWVNKQKTRAQFMALLVAYMMRTTVCGPYKQRHLTSSPSETEAIASV
ncbi:uncharacterized protein TM35_000013910 [Trypanosoma theileri]|uniref:Uncharacterized protein n=1 Tax=Trypanosoma theileri TaxID=67003 RepID=A0A1X0P9A9_9TRYP|nr:uncharacterized protein TM35_000013910 [Trypanosoma theileri]ORC93514.1 hypothetical protein TM35_000013910 [Trypanosoma theileri]